MSALKHMEFIFGAVMVAGCVYAALPDAAVTPPPTQAAATAAGRMQVVVVKGKRMTALEKRRSLELEAGEHRRTAGA
ncbi:MAG: hypothetical protein M3R60_12710 [Pseudomonadota bacterium]|nr:hypothetical protein [Pseudomonadota bacterium]